MSYKAPKANWDALHYAGITQIIDMRYKYNTVKFLVQCQKYGFRFYYPKHNAPDTMANMVKNFYHFTELLAPDFITFSFFVLCHIMAPLIFRLL